MNWVFADLSVKAAVLLICCCVNGSLAAIREGSIEMYADVHASVDIEFGSVVGNYSVVEANVHLYKNVDVHDHCILRANVQLNNGCRVGSYVEIGENVEIRHESQVLAHSRIERDAKIGAYTVCEPYTSLGIMAELSHDVRIKEHAQVGSKAFISNFAVIGPYASIGNNSEVRRHTKVAPYARVGANVTVAASVIVEPFVVIPSGTVIGEGQVVVNSPETNTLVRSLYGTQFMPRFITAAESLVRLSDESFTQQMSRDIDIILNRLRNECQSPKNVFPQLKLQIYAYLARMFGMKKVNELMKSGMWNVDDCMEPKRFDKILGEDTVRKFILMMALNEDFQRGEDFCTIAMNLFSGRRSVLAINEKCGGTITINCIDGSCRGSPSSPDIEHWLTDDDVYMY